MNIKDIKNLYLCCPYCKTTLYLLKTIYSSFYMNCCNIQCINYNKSILTGSVYGYRGDQVSYCVFSFNDEQNRVFYCDDRNCLISYNYSFFIKLTNEKFLDMLKIYAKKFDLKDIKDKYDTLMLFK